MYACAESLRLLVAVLLVVGQQGVGSRPLLVFLIDGFRYDYMDDLNALPGFRQLVENGVKVDYVTPDFPSLSYPNYYSLMTGRNSDVHQMTGNYMWDEVSMKEFLIGTNPDSRLPLWWDGSEPIWVTVQKKGNVRMYYWPGCEVEILGVRPSFCEEYVYNPSVKNLTDSIENALDSLQSGKAEMAAIYYEKIDVEGHHFGPDSHQIKTAVRELDTAMQTLNKKIKEKNMGDKLNVMLFSDHGMTKIQWMERVIELDKYINMSDIVKMMDRGVVVSLWPKHNKHQEVKSEICEFLAVPGTNPQRFVAHRWLSAYDVGINTRRMLPAYKVLYFGFLSQADQTLYQEVLEEIFKDHHVSERAKARIQFMHQDHKKKGMTQIGKERKERVVKKLWFESLNTDLQLSIYLAVLPILKEYVMVFQGSQTLVHKLQDKQLEVLTSFMACCIRSEHLHTSPKTLVEMEIKDKMLPLTELYVGPVAEKLRAENPRHPVYSALSQVPNMGVYEKQNIPDRFHYKGGKFVPPLTLVAEPGWFITENKATLPYWNNGTGVASGWQKGWHGYDNTFIDMRAFFLATGPDFKKGVQAAPIRAVDIYNLMCRTMGVEPLPNNGSWSRVEYLLSRASNQPRPVLPWSLLMGLLLILLVSCWH